MKIMLEDTEMWPIYFTTKDGNRWVNVPWYKKLWWDMVWVWFGNMQNSLSQYWNSE
jgi:hypothetical protein